MKKGLADFKSPKSSKSPKALRLNFDKRIDAAKQTFLYGFEKPKPNANVSKA